MWQEKGENVCGSMMEWEKRLVASPHFISNFLFVSWIIYWTYVFLEVDLDDKLCLRESNIIYFKKKVQICHPNIRNSLSYVIYIKSLTHYLCTALSYASRGFHVSLMDKDSSPGSCCCRHHKLFLELPLWRSFPCSDQRWGFWCRLRHRGELMKAEFFLYSFISLTLNLKLINDNDDRVTRIYISWMVCLLKLTLIEWINYTMKYKYKIELKY